jgi:hypothetical protein
MASLETNQQQELEESESSAAAATGLGGAQAEEQRQSEVSSNSEDDDEELKGDCCYECMVSKACCRACPRTCACVLGVVLPLWFLIFLSLCFGEYVAMKLEKSMPIVFRSSASQCFENLNREPGTCWTHIPTSHFITAFVYHRCGSG